MRLAGKEKKKNFSPEFGSNLTCAWKFRKKQKKNSKNQKTSFQQYSQPKRDEIGREREKKNLSRIPFTLDPDKKIPKKIAKELKKLKKKPLSDNIPIQNGMRQAEKEKKKFYVRIPFMLDSGKKIPKKIANKLKKLKNLFPTLFFAKTG